MEANYFTVLWWFLPFINMNQPQVHMCAPIQKPSTPPSPPHLSGLSQSTNFECTASCIKLALVICFTCGNIHISMLFSQLIHHCLHPHSPKVCSLHLCLLCYIAYRVIVTVFLNSIYIYICVNRLYWCFSF